MSKKSYNIFQRLYGKIVLVNYVNGGRDYSQTGKCVASNDSFLVLNNVDGLSRFISVSEIQKITELKEETKNV